MKTKVVLGARLLLGLMFLVFGLNGFLNFLPAPPMEPQALEVLGALSSAGYLKVVKSLEILSGILLLVGVAVPLALVTLAPIVVAITLFHIFVAPGLGTALVIWALGLFLAWNYKERFAPLFHK